MFIILSLYDKAFWYGETSFVRGYSCNIEWRTVEMHHLTLYG
ncbi:hypothetical protein VCR29J2_680073 [Vibrio coralliirubri]|nr:hypothetical protein VCR29J2_680073 [Vibrio coralliirubri]